MIAPGTPRVTARYAEALTRAIALLLVLVGLPAGSFQHLRVAHLPYWQAPDQSSALMIEARKPIAREEASADVARSVAHGNDAPAAATACPPLNLPATPSACAGQTRPSRLAGADALLPYATGPPLG